MTAREPSEEGRRERRDRGGPSPRPDRPERVDGWRADALHLIPRTEEIEVLAADDLRAEEPHWFNVPNALTFLRALLVPVILVLVAQDDPSAQWWAFGIFVFAAATDSIDGWVARRWHGVTRWGQLADPIADKMLIVGALASLAVFGRLPWWAVIVIVGREMGVTLLRVVLVRRNDIVMPASWWGKSKTISQVIAVGLFLMPQGVADSVELWVLYVAIVLTLWSGIDYAFRAGRLSKEAAPSAAGATPVDG